jgi:hypothetical protein
MRRVYWTCEHCGKQTDGRGGIDDAMDCMCSRCGVCREVVQDCSCEHGDDYWDEGDDYHG